MATLEQLQEIKKRGLSGKISSSVQSQYDEAEKRGMLGESEPREVNIPEPTSFLEELSKELPRGVKNIRRDIGAVLPFEGLQEKAEAVEDVIKSFGKTSYKDNLKDIRDDKALWRKQKRDNLGNYSYIGDVAEITGGMATGGMAGKALKLPQKIAAGGKLLERAVDAGTGAIEAGTLSNTPAGYVLGGITGLVLPEVADKVGRGLNKLKVGKLVNKGLNAVNLPKVNAMTKVDGTPISEVLSDKKLYKKLQKGAKGGAAVRDSFTPKAAKYQDELRGDLYKSIDNNLDVKVDRAALKTDAYDRYGELMANISTKPADKQAIDATRDSLQSKIEKKYFDEALQAGGMETRVGEGSIDQINEAQKYLRNKSAKMNISDSAADKAKIDNVRSKFKDILRDADVDYDAVNAEYAISRQSPEAYEAGKKATIAKYKGDNESGKVTRLTDFQDEKLQDVYRQGYSDNLRDTVKFTARNPEKKILDSKLLMKEILPESQTSKVLQQAEDNRALNKKMDNVFSELAAADNTVKSPEAVLNDSTASKRLLVKALSSIKSFNPVVGGVIAGELSLNAAKDAVRGGRAMNMLEGYEQLNPIVKALIAQQLGRKIGE